MTVEQTLSERGNKYGDFKDHAFITQQFKQVMEDSPNGASLKAYQEEALDMIFHKIARILNGDPDYIDSWHDIVGYAKLVEQQLKAESKIKEEEFPKPAFNEEFEKKLEAWRKSNFVDLYTYKGIKTHIE